MAKSSPILTEAAQANDLANRPLRESDQNAATRVLSLVALGAEQMRLGLDGNFSRVIDRLERIPGKVVVTGMGKSGHVARKIAATLASTGSPSFFVHPAEASHGDMGMITQSDAVLALSNSGETAELEDIVIFTRRYQIPLIAMTRGENSSLAAEADEVLLLPQVPESCPNGLAPTTSTSLMMALGDAVAMALLERRGFSAEDFRVLHPGGSLGRHLRRVQDIMHQGDEIPLLAGDPSTGEAILAMTRKHFGCVGLIDDQGKLSGIVTDGDLRRHMASDLLNRKARDIMTTQPVTIRKTSLIAEALGVMNSKSITALFVVEQGQPIGIIHIHDCLKLGAG
ncbi:MAG: KpsF/GutQ family sugar-phosphate isomerase [Candidatus Symbiobacter sp.]|nr:KpsF/GutQ family sugar-phosphate isomerase [Candidatus Symbiobacter sp.]